MPHGAVDFRLGPFRYTRASERYLLRWTLWATHSRLAPVIDVAKAIKRHWAGVFAFIRSRITNSIVKGLNSKIKTALKRAYGFKMFESGRTMLKRAQSPQSPEDATTSSARVKRSSRITHAFLRTLPGGLDYWRVALHTPPAAPPWKLHAHTPSTRRNAAGLRELKGAIE